MKILITGANGFLGKECIKKLSINNYTIITTDTAGDVEFKGDLADKNFASSLPDADVVVHCAAVQYVSRNLPLLFRKKYFKKNNVIATQNLCNRYSGNNTHFINVATSMMYKQIGDYVYKPSSPMLGEGVYSKSKLASMTLVNTMPNQTANVIPCIIGGKGREGLFIGFVKMLQKFNFVAFPGKGDHKIHMVHVSDVAELIHLIIEKKATGLFNAAAPNPLSIKEWVAEIADEINIPNYKIFRIPISLVRVISYVSMHRVIAKEQLIMLQKTHVLSIEDSLSLGWQPKFDNARIVRDIATHIANI